MKTTKKTITQKEIAKQAEIGADFLSHILHGRRPCPPRVAIRLEAITGVDRSTWVWAEPPVLRAAVDEACRK